ncbi:MAG: SMI1/KNR4 family protein [Ruminococcus sp.]|nr:SMI1/KNR4 family protein [Ruminococcus sp.]
MKNPDNVNSAVSERFERIMKACVYLCEKGIYPRDSYYTNPPATEEEIAELESRTNQKLPDHYTDFLRISNGFKFVHFEIYGTRDFGKNDGIVPDDFITIGKSSDGAQRLAVSPAGVYLCYIYPYPSPDGTFVKQPTLFRTEMHKLMTTLEEEAEKQRQKEKNESGRHFGRR